MTNNGKLFKVSSLTFKIFHSFLEELELLPEGVCSFHVPSRALVFLEAARDAHGIPTTPAFFCDSVTPSCGTSSLIKNDHKDTIIPNDTYRLIPTF